jgi:hypothetical protein
VARHCALPSMEYVDIEGKKRNATISIISKERMNVL